MSGWDFDESLGSVRVIITRLLTPVVMALVVFGWFYTQASAGGKSDGIIYNNGASQNQFLPIDQIPPFNLQPPQKVIGWATSRGGEVTSFEFGYFTPAQEANINITFYSGTNENSNGTMIAKFQFTNSPGGAEQFINHDISGQPFTLPEGPFG